MAMWLLARKLVQIQGVMVPAVTAHKFLGVMLDQELNWK